MSTQPFWGLMHIVSTAQINAYKLVKTMEPKGFGVHWGIY
jgi:hypothetical protein